MPELKPTILIIEGKGSPCNMAGYYESALGGIATILNSNSVEEALRHINNHFSGEVPIHLVIATYHIGTSISGVDDNIFNTEELIRSLRINGFTGPVIGSNVTLEAQTGLRRAMLSAGCDCVPDMKGFVPEIAIEMLWKSKAQREADEIVS